MSGHVDANLHRLLSDQREFVRVREWEQFHTPKNLAMALGGEVGELASAIGQLLSDTPHTARIDEIHTDVVDELGDVTLYLLRLYDVAGIDPESGFDGVVDPSTEPCPWPSTPAELFALARAAFDLAGTAGRLLESLQWEANSASTESHARLAQNLPPRLNATAESLRRVGELLGVDVVHAAAAKNGKNMTKYPVELSRGSSRKYTELDTGTH
ncbi:NTP pyrophosphatase (non-canonical NTP hydrolase) [Rhodococcus sp. OK611]|nr:NTP pyrophosphatase (non-canonical NTP hydrolase) [Rhodococcus sp. OK611]